MPFRNEDPNEKGLVGIGIDLTERCNRQCPTCYANNSYQDMDINVFKKIVDEGFESKFKEFYILGGEPTLHPKILECLEYIKGKFRQIILVTNMDRLSDLTFCQKIFEAGVTIAGQRHTMDSDMQAEILEKTISGKNTLYQSHRAWENVTKIFPPDHICVQCCITKPVVESESIFKLFRWIRKNGYGPVMEFTKEGHSFKRGCALDVSPEEMKKTLEKFQKIDREEFGLEEVKLLSPQAYGKNCHMQEKSIHFLVDGTAIPCVGHHNINYGNIRKDSLQSILENSLRQFIKNPHEWIFGYCRDECPHFDECTGGCRGSSFDMSGCYRASFYYCPHIPRERLKLKDMIPPSCEGCPLKGHFSCNPKRGA